jgi:hypothetical protein
MSHISSFVKHRGHTNNIINAPHRHELDATSYINNEVIKWKMLEYAVVIEPDISTEYAKQTTYE